MRKKLNTGNANNKIVRNLDENIKPKKISDLGKKSLFPKYKRKHSYASHDVIKSVGKLLKGASFAPSFGAKQASKKENNMSTVPVATYKVTDNNSKDDCTLTFTPEILSEFEKQLCDKKLSNKLDLEIIEESFRDPDGNLPEGIVELYEELIRSQ